MASVLLEETFEPLLAANEAFYWKERIPAQDWTLGSKQKQDSIAGMPSAAGLAILEFPMRYLRRTALREQAQSGEGCNLTTEPLRKVVGPGPCGLLASRQRQACRYDLTGGSKPICFKRLRILNAFEIALWQTRSTSKRADVILELPSTTTLGSSERPQMRTPRGRRAEDVFVHMFR